MKITDELVQSIEEMEELNIPEEKIKKFLKLKDSITEIKEEYYKYEDYVKVSEAVPLLKEYLGKLKDDKGYELKILRLLEKGEIKGKKLSNKEGYRIKKTEIQRFIEDSSKTKEDWKNEAKKCKKEALSSKEEAKKWEREANIWKEEALKFKAMYEESFEKKLSEVTEIVSERQMAIEDVEAEEVSETANTEQSETPQNKKLTISPVSSITVMSDTKKKKECMIIFKINGVKIITDAFLEDDTWSLSKTNLSDYPFKEVEKNILPKLKKEWKDGKGEKVNNLS